VTEGRESRRTSADLPLPYRKSEEGSRIDVVPVVEGGERTDAAEGDGGARLVDASSVLADLSKLQREVDALRGVYEGRGGT
jgi:hypothetical protein